MTSFSNTFGDWRVGANSVAMFEIELPRKDATDTDWTVTVGGIPAAWVQSTVRHNRAYVTFTIPAHTPPQKYPISLTFVAVLSPLQRYNLRHMIDISAAPPVSHLQRLRQRVGWRWPVSSAVLLVVVVMGMRWLLTPSALIESAYDANARLVAARSNPLATLPVVIQPQWQAALPLPPLAPTPTLIPTPTPLPPLPTPLPPPPLPAVVESRGVEASVHSDYTYERLFQEVGEQFGVDWRLLASIAYRESGLTPDAVGGSGEQGMMQIMPDTWAEFAPRVGESDPFDPYASTRVAAYYLTYLRDYLYSQGYTEPYWLLVAYNWGPNNLRQHLAADGDWGGIPTMRQNYAYTIIGTVNDESRELWNSGVKALVPE